MSHGFPHPIYRFGEPKDSWEHRTAGDVIPHRMQTIQRQMPDGEWETIGYLEAHLHVVKMDADDLTDVSVGTTVRINPKLRLVP